MKLIGRLAVVVDQIQAAALGGDDSHKHVLAVVEQRTISPFGSWQFLLVGRKSQKFHLYPEPFSCLVVEFRAIIYPLVAGLYFEQRLCWETFRTFRTLGRRITVKFRWQ